MPQGPISLLSLLPTFIPGFRQVDGGDCAALAGAVLGYKKGLVALAGGGGIIPPGAGSAVDGSPQLVLGINEVKTVVTDHDSVFLPPALGGAQVYVFNNDGQILDIWGALAGYSSNQDYIVGAPSLEGAKLTHISLATVKVAQFLCYKPGIWKVLLSA